MKAIISKLLYVSALVSLPFIGFSFFLTTQDKLILSLARSLNVLFLLLIWFRSREANRPLPRPFSQLKSLILEIQKSRFEAGALFISSIGLFAIQIFEYFGNNELSKITWLQICLLNSLRQISCIFLLTQFFAQDQRQREFGKKNTFLSLFASHALIVTMLNLCFPQASRMVLFLYEASTTLLIVSFALVSTWCRPSANNFFLKFLVVVISIFYWWCVNISSSEKVEFSSPFREKSFVLDRNMSYSPYLWQTEGFFRKKLSLSIEPSEGLLKSPNPYDPKQRNYEFAGDMSFYKGKYYSYFGIVPVLMVYYPIRLLTGRRISDTQVTFLFAVAGLVISLLLGRLIIKNHFPSTPTWITPIIYLFFSTNNILTYLIPSHDVYHIAIICGYSLLTLGLYFLVRSLKASDPNRDILLSSLCFGLAVGCRPLTALYFMLLVGRVAFDKVARSRGLLINFVHVCAPFFCLLFLLGLYNFLRFGSWTEFGISYQLTYINVGHARRSLLMIPHGLWMFFMTPFRVDAAFPIFRIESGIIPFDHSSYDFQMFAAIGLFFLTPATLLVLGSMLSKLTPRYNLFQKDPLSQLMLGCVAVAIGEAAVIAYVGTGVTARYLLDFTPALSLPTAVLFLDQYLKLSSSHGLHKDRKDVLLRGALTGFFCLAVFYGALCSFALSFTGLNHHLETDNPQVFQKIRTILDY